MGVKNKIKNGKTLAVLEKNLQKIEINYIQNMIMHEIKIKNCIKIYVKLPS
jgi:hypothetical protein